MAATPTALDLRNIRLFLTFRVFFNARFYYPVFMLLFVDYGLTPSQFFYLNIVWAASWVLLEIPSGAMADLVGRRNLLVVTGILMIVEMAVLAFAPTGNPTLLLVLFTINRVLSGFGEAAASGADEALAYDTLAAEGIEDQWSRVLEWAMRLSSIAFPIALLVGGVVYDAEQMNRILGWIGLEANLTTAETMRFPIYLCLGTAVITLLAALGLREPKAHVEQAEEATSAPDPHHPVRSAFAVTLNAGLWILRSPLALVVIAGGLMFDSVIRTFVTSTSVYYEVIGFTPAQFGIIGALTGALGIFTSRLARNMAEHRSPLFNVSVIATLGLTGLVGLPFAVAFWGVLATVPLFVGFGFVTFFVSFYLNRVAPSKQRATILSFKGLAFNLGYGVIGLFFGLVLDLERAGLEGLTGKALDQAVYVEALEWLPWLFAVSFGLFLLFAGWKLNWKRPKDVLMGAKPAPEQA